MADNKENLISSWDWANKHVQPKSQINEARFVNGASVLISAGPPRLSGPKSDPKQAETSPSESEFSNIVFPIGVCLNANISQQRALQRFYEIGSERCYFIQGHSQGTLSLNRVLFNGANVLRVLYAYYPVKASKGDGGILDLGGNPVQDAKDGMVESDDRAMASVAQSTENSIEKYTGEDKFPQIKMNPGYNNMYINLASDLFNHPVGLMFTFQDAHKRTFANFYCEMCHVMAHGMSIDSNAGSVVAESVQMQFDRIASIKVT